MTLMTERPKRKSKAAGQEYDGNHEPVARPSEKGSQAKTGLMSSDCMPANPEPSATSQSWSGDPGRFARRGPNKREASIPLSPKKAVPHAQSNAADQMSGSQIASVRRNGKGKQATRRVTPIVGLPASPADGAKAEGQGAVVLPCGDAFPFARLMERQVQHRRAMRMRIRCENDGIAYAARLLGFTPALAEKERTKLFDSARGIFDAIRNDKPFESGLSAVQDLELKMYCGIAANVGNCYRAAEAKIEAEIEELASRLPVASFVAAIRGLTNKGLGHIIGETGNLSDYAGPAKVWKRLGLAPYNGKAGSTWKREGGLSADEWTSLGYVSSRRSVMYVVGEPLMKLNDGKYRAKYEARRAHTAVSHPDWSKGHSHLDAMRIMVKELVKDLWRAWRDMATA